MNLANLKTKIKGFEENVSSLKGKISLLEDQFVEANEMVESLKELQVTNKKSIELMNVVQSVTKDRIQETFETIVGNALKFIHQDDSYDFALEFGRRGNVPELNFAIKTPDMQEAHNILHTKGGGTTDIVAFALRFVLLEISQNKGFVFFDEPFAHLDSPETSQKAIEFFNELQKETSKQIFMITHRQDVIDSSERPLWI
ncbi:MAG: hypothetical protein ACTSWD_12810, partial [Candidatus Heimdallarchaeota archaeon]